MTLSSDGRILGLDYGERKIGVAITDPLRITAQGVGVRRREGKAKDLAYFADLCQEKGVAEIVVGLPLRTDGSRGESARRAEMFARDLKEATGLPVALWDERFTSTQAERTMIEAGMRREKRREVRDMAAAKLILQAYMESRER